MRKTQKQNARSKYKPLITAFACHETQSAKEFEYKMKIMMASDGFSCGYDRYKIFDKNEMMKIAEIKGIDYIYRKVRELEKDDEMAIEFPRFKIYDDSSCVYLEIYKY
ncbi:hypothetical protein ACEI72_05510 [Clostridioides difficile]